jgi:hypothetical protein
MVKKVKTDRGGCEYSLLRVWENDQVGKLVDLYKEDPRLARVIYMHTPNNYSTYRLALFEHGNGDFEIAYIKKTFGISITNRMYSREKKISSLVFKGGKFWVIQNGIIKPLTLNLLSNYITSIEGSKNKIEDSPIYGYLDKRFHWIKNISDGDNILWGYLTFTQIYKNKLWGLKDMYSFLLKVPRNKVRVLLDSNLLNNYTWFNNLGWGSSINAWKKIIPYLTHIEFLHKDMLTSEYFIDACKMAKTLDKRINCKWGVKRLKLEHDNWSHEISSYLYKTLEERELNILRVYRDFANFSGYKLLKTNKDLLFEGLRLSHCVGNYIDNVDSGDTGIFSVSNNTLQLRIIKKNEKSLGTFVDIGFSKGYI